MKKILSAIALSAAIGAQVNAQVFTVEYLNNSNDTIIATGSPAEIKPMVKLVLEPGIDTMTYDWQVQEFSVPSDWTLVGLCDNNGCYDANTPYFTLPYAVNTNANPVWNDTAATFQGDKMYVWLDVPLAASTGLAYFKYKVTSKDVYPSAMQPATPQEVEILYVIRKDITVSVNTITIPENAIRLYPNPATGILNVDIASDLKISTAKVVDMQGKVILTTPMNGKSIDIQHLNSGMYTVDFLNADGVRLTTRKFVKQ